MVAPPEAGSSVYFGRHGCQSVGLHAHCLFVCLQSTRREGESTKGATLAPYCPITNPAGRVKIMALEIMNRHNHKAANMLLLTDNHNTAEEILRYFT